MFILVDSQRIMCRHATLMYTLMHSIVMAYEQLSLLQTCCLQHTGGAAIPARVHQQKHIHRLFLRWLGCRWWGSTAAASNRSWACWIKCNMCHLPKSWGESIVTFSCCGLCCAINTRLQRHARCESVAIRLLQGCMTSAGGVIKYAQRLEPNREKYRVFLALQACERMLATAKSSDGHRQR